MRQFPIGYLYAGLSAHNPSVPSFNNAALRNASTPVKGLDITRVALNDAEQLIRNTKVLVVESSCLLGRTNAGGEPRYRRFRRDVDTKVVSAIIDMAWSSTSTLVLLEGNYDIHAPLGFGLSVSEMKRIDYLIWPYTSEPVGYGTGERPARYVEPWIREKLDPIENWRAITKAIPKQIEYHHSLAESDFGNPSSLKIWDAVVPGAQYVTREIASASARAEDLSLAPYPSLDRTLRLSGSFIRGFSGRAGDFMGFKLRRMNMKQLMRHSRGVYVCGGGPEYFVRKFLEVPALGLPMFGYPVEPLARLGFREDEHYIRTLPEDFGRLLSDLLSHSPSQLSAMSCRSKTMVEHLHTARTRAENLLQLVSWTQDRSFKRAIFVDGSVVPVE